VKKVKKFPILNVPVMTVVAVVVRRSIKDFPAKKSSEIIFSAVLKTQMVDEHCAQRNSFTTQSILLI